MALTFPATKYKLQSVSSGKVFNDTGWMLDAPDENIPGLIRAVYEKNQLNLLGKDYGLYTFSNWLPVQRLLKGSWAPATFRSEGLAKELGLSNLWITFSGYWPEKGVEMKTCTFKETEAYSVCARMDNVSDKVMVVASAGNTARAFARVCSDNKIPLLLCVPEDNIDALWFDTPIHDCVKLIVSESGSDYFDAIHLSNLAIQMDKYYPEGGAKNIARRDGMATTVLSAVTTIGEIPEYYFQAVGSGTGAIAAWEANLRFLQDGRWGNQKMKLMVSQNEPFTPIHDAWKAGSREMLPLDDHLARKQVEAINAKVLSNRKPPYSLAGGLYDALVDSHGDVLLATNEEAKRANKLFLETEGNDLSPAAAIGLATLIKSSQDGTVNKDALIIMNITGGGEKMFKSEKRLFYLEPSLTFQIDPDFEEVKDKLEKLF